MRTWEGDEISAETLYMDWLYAVERDKIAIELTVTTLHRLKYITDTEYREFERSTRAAKRGIFTRKGV